jgi:hypothetical protein
LIDFRKRPARGNRFSVFAVRRRAQRVRATWLAARLAEVTFQYGAGIGRTSTAGRPAAAPYGANAKADGCLTPGA